MKTVLFLTYRMMSGFGVDVVVAQIGRVLQQRGYRVVVGCIDAEPGFADLNIELVSREPTAAEIRALATRVAASVVVAHTSPFFELLPELQKDILSWAWEHGEPTPSFFDDHDFRHRRIEDKKVVYPQLSGVIAISDFVKEEICFPGAHVIYNGCDHVPPVGSKDQQDIVTGEQRPLRVGTLMRLAPAESLYKGNAAFRALAERLLAVDRTMDICVMGRGSQSEARAFQDAGLRAYLNATDEQKWRYLRKLDVFIACSLWEGFNLPLVEAQAMGTVGLALDTGAHPEVTPLLMGNVDEAFAQILAYNTNRPLLLRHSALSWHFVRDRFNWERTALTFERLALK